MKLRTSLFTIFACSFFAVACSKTDDTVEKKEDCRTTKTYLYDAGVVADSFVYTYNTDNTVQKIAYGSGSYYTLEYEGAKIVKRHHVHSGDVLKDQTEVITYNSNGTIKQIEKFNKAMNLVARKVFVHNVNKLVGIEDYDGFGTLQARYTYTYTINNITKLDAEEYWGGSKTTYQMAFNYGTNPNFFKTGEQSLLNNGFFSSQFSVSIPYALSDNNVREVEYQGNKVPVNYTFDDRQNITEVRTGNDLLMRSVYECR